MLHYQSAHILRLIKIAAFHLVCSKTEGLFRGGNKRISDTYFPHLQVKNFGAGMLQTCALRTGYAPSYGLPRCVPACGI